MPSETKPLPIQTGLPPWPPKAERPRWERPGNLEIAIGVFGVFLGIAGTLIPNEIARLPNGLRWGLFVGPLAAALIWVGRMVYQEFAVASQRVREYPNLYSLAETEHRLVVEERARLHEVTRTLTMLALHAEIAQTVVFEMIESVMSDEDVLLAIVTADNLIPRVGQRLTVVDPQDGKLLGELEATELRIVDGNCLARVTGWDALFLGYVVDKAIRRESLQLRARAFYISQSENAQGAEK